MEFVEKQSLKLWWLYILLAIDAVIMLSIVLFDKGGMSAQDLKNIYFAPIWAVLLPLAILLIIKKNILTIKIDNYGISYKYLPFTLKFKCYPWTNLEKVYINKYNALGNYGGWGIRYRLWFKFRDKAYLLNDKDKGLQLEFKNGRRLLFSSNKAEELELFLINLKTKYNMQAVQ